MSFFIIPSGESYCNDRSKEFSENKNIYESVFYYGNKKIMPLHIDKGHIESRAIRERLHIESYCVVMIMCWNNYIAHEPAMTNGKEKNVGWSR